MLKKPQNHRGRAEDVAPIHKETMTMTPRSGPSAGKGAHAQRGGVGRPTETGRHIRVLAIEEERSEAGSVALVLEGLADIQVVTSASAHYDPSLAVQSLDPQALVLNMAAGAHLGCIKLGRAARGCNPELGIVVVAHEREFAAVRALIQAEEIGWTVVSSEALGDRDSMAQAIRNAVGCVESSTPPTPEEGSSPGDSHETEGPPEPAHRDSCAENVPDRDGLGDAAVFAQPESAGNDSSGTPDQEREGEPSGEAGIGDSPRGAWSALTRSISEWAEGEEARRRLASVLRSEPKDAVEAAQDLLDQATRTLVASELVDEVSVEGALVPEDPATCRRVASELGLISEEIRQEIELLVAVRDACVSSDPTRVSFGSRELQERLAQLQSPVLYARKLGFWRPDETVESKCPLGVSGPRYWWSIAVLSMLGVLASRVRRVMLANLAQSDGHHAAA